MNKIYPEKLREGDEVRVIAPSRSLSLIGREVRDIANKRFSDLKLKLTFSENVEETDMFNSSTIESRVKDIHTAFGDKNVRAIITVIGGFNSNQLLRYIDWELIKNNPKIFCGYSDITALNNAIFAKTGLVTYSGPHYSTFGQKLFFEYSLEYFKKCLFGENSFAIYPSDKWSSNDSWWIDQNKRTYIKNEGFLAINEGEVSGTILGANICTFNLLQGTEYFPDLDGSILFLEDDYESQAHTFDRDLQSLIHLQRFSGVKGLVIGRFQNESKVTSEALIKIIKSKKELEKIPVIANVDFGHTDPKITFPVGGEVKIISSKDKINIEIVRH